MQRTFAWIASSFFFFVGCGTSASTTSPSDAATDTIEGGDARADGGHDATPDTTVEPEGGVDGDEAGGESGPSSVYPAFKPARPQLTGASAVVIDHPVFVPIFFGADPDQKMIEDTMSAFLSSKYWSLDEYGVHEAKKADAIVLAETPPSTMNDDDIANWLENKLDGTHPEFGPVDAGALGERIYVPFFPATTSVVLRGEDLCSYFFSSHEGAPVGAGVAQWAVIPRCAGSTLPFDRDQVGYYFSSVAYSVAANPVDHFGGSTGWAYFDDDHAAYDGGGEEVGTACGELGFILPAALGFKIVRKWSNASAAAYHDPCISIDDTHAWGTGAPVPKDMVTYKGAMHPGVLLPRGTTQTIDVQVFSDGPTDAPMRLFAEDKFYPGFPGGLTVTLDRNTALNGETVHVTFSGSLPAGDARPIVIATRTTFGQSNEWVLVGTK